MRQPNVLGQSRIGDKREKVRHLTSSQRSYPLITTDTPTWGKEKAEFYDNAAPSNQFTLNQ
jgi:hypothetical protein